MAERTYKRARRVYVADDRGVHGKVVFFALYVTFVLTYETRSIPFVVTSQLLSSLVSD